jgi:hypothetical protein
LPCCLLSLGACTPLVTQQAGRPPLGFSGPRFERDAFVSFDGARPRADHLAAKGQPWAVVIALHGMNDYANAFHFAGPAWAEQGITTYAYDQRGFGRSPQRGIWGGEDLMVEDLRTAVAVVRARHPGRDRGRGGREHGRLGGAAAFASDQPPAADRLLAAVARRLGFKAQPLPNKTLLWLAANFTGGRSTRRPAGSPPRSIRPTIARS